MNNRDPLENVYARLLQIARRERQKAAAPTGQSENAAARTEPTRKAQAHEVYHAAAESRQLSAGGAV